MNLNESKIAIVVFGQLRSFPWISIWGLPLEIYLNYTNRNYTKNSFWLRAELWETKVFFYNLRLIPKLEPKLLLLKLFMYLYNQGITLLYCNAPSHLCLLYSWFRMLLKDYCHLKKGTESLLQVSLYCKWQQTKKHTIKMYLSGLIG